MKMAVMRILVAPDKFKGTLTAAQAAEAIEAGWRRVFPRAIYDRAPLADGGDGFLTVMTGSRADRIEQVHGIEDARFRKRTVALGWIDGGRTAVVEMARVCGLSSLEPRLRNPMYTTTLGVGRLIRHAWEKGAKRILVGLGGTATNDGGIGLAVGLGFAFRDARGRLLEPVGDRLGRIVRIEAPPGWQGRLPGVDLVAAVDVTNPLTGPRGAARMFAPQKGASARQVRALDSGLARFSRKAGSQAARLPGAGAAGGAAYGLVVFAGAELVRGFDLVAERMKLEERIRRADLVLTGEGALDAQTALGKAPGRVLDHALRWGRPVIAFAGRVESPGAFDAVFPLVETGDDPAAAMAAAARRLRDTVERAARAFACGRKLRTRPLRAKP